MLVLTTLTLTTLALTLLVTLTDTHTYKRWC